MPESSEAEASEMADPPRMTDAEATEFRRRRNGRNVAILIVLIALSTLFFAITIVKMAKF